MSPTQTSPSARERSSPAREVVSSAGAAASALGPTDTFIHRHIGPSDEEIASMLATLGCSSLEGLVEATVPESIRTGRPLSIGPARGEHELLEELRGIARQNQVFRSFIGMGYYGTITPPVIQRNVLENPGWYTQYTPYQAEIAQGRLEALLNFQTMVADLTALPLAGASLLDEATAAAEAMAMCFAIAGGREGARKVFLVAEDCHPQTIAVCATRAEPLGIELVVGAASDFFDANDASGARVDPSRVCGVLVQYPTTDGLIVDYSGLAARAHRAGAQVVAATDLLALTLIRPPGEWGADIAVGSAQRFGVPMGFGGPHAGFIATRNEHARRMPGRIIGVSRDAQGNPALRMAIQTREQHIKRERATSNICTAQALLAIMASMYAVYHGPEGLRAIASRVRQLTVALTTALKGMGYARRERIASSTFFDTIRVHAEGGLAGRILARAAERRVNLRDYGDGTLGISLDETVNRAGLEAILESFGLDGEPADIDQHIRRAAEFDAEYNPPFARTSEFLTHPVFNTHHSETEMLRYIFRLQERDLSLAHSMIPLGSCTMKLNATSEMLPVTWPEFAHLHPFAPAEQARGYRRLFDDLEKWLSEITGFDAVSLQPNAGSQGEYAGLLAIRAYHASRGEGQRDVCLIPTSAHGTNPASAVIAGMRVVPVECDPRGNVRLDDLRARAEEHARELACLMITYPSTHGVFEEGIRDICAIVHEHGGQVYMDGANMNAQVGLCRPAEIGADVCHLNLHKTFCIPHGGGGPGMGPIGVAAHLAPFLPGYPLEAVRRGRGDHAESAERKAGGPDRGASSGSASSPSSVSAAPATSAYAVGPVAAAPWGSASILPISWMYIALMGSGGLTRATQVAILNANYMARRLEGHYPVLYTGRNGRVAHEFILDCRAFDKSAGVKIDDIAKRLIDYGFHAPTMSFPVPGTLMIEPTESESKAELDRFCDALIAIREEVREIEEGRADRADNLLKGAPFTAAAAAADTWPHAYGRERAAFPAPWVRERKFWPPVGRVDNPYGDRNLVCVCPPVDTYG